MNKPTKEATKLKKYKKAEQSNSKTKPKLTEKNHPRDFTIEMNTKNRKKQKNEIAGFSVLFFRCFCLFFLWKTKLKTYTNFMNFQLNTIFQQRQMYVKNDNYFENCSINHKIIKKKNEEEEEEIKIPNHLKQMLLSRISCNNCELKQLHKQNELRHSNNYFKYIVSIW